MRYEFHKNHVIYVSAFEGSAFCSFHNRAGMTEEQAKKAFHREHLAEVAGLIAEKKQKTITSN